MTASRYHWMRIPTFSGHKHLLLTRDARTSLCGLLSPEWEPAWDGQTSCTGCLDALGASATPEPAPAPLEYAGDALEDPHGEPCSDFASFGDVLPPGAVPVRGIKIVSFLDDEGDPCYEWRLFGSNDLITLLGLLQFVQLRAYQRRWDEGDGEGDDSDG